MALPIKIETLMWLLPVVFMLHDFEEIIMIKPWMNHHAPELQERFPRLAARFLTHFDRISTSSLALAVAEEFILLTLWTLVTVERGLYSVWAGVLLGFFIHLVVHLVQFIVYRGYVPAIITSALASLYCLGALYWLHASGSLIWSQVIAWTVIAVIVIVVNLILAHGLAARFERYLREQFPSR
jgi:hypothetical protein